MLSVLGYRKCKFAFVVCNYAAEADIVFPKVQIVS